MVRAVSRRPVPVAPAVVAREEALDRREEILLRSGAELHDHQSGRRVRDEDDEQAVSLTRDEALAHRREVEHAAAAAGLNADLARLHGASLLWPLAA